MIKVVLIGSGNVARHLFNVFTQHTAFELIQIVGRNGQALKNFGPNVNCTTDFSKIKDSDIYIIAVSDDAIPSISKLLESKDGLIVHTSGNTPIGVLSNHKRSGVFYPLQTFSKNRKVDFRNVPFCLEASNREDLELLKKMASHISDSVFEVSSNQRESLHVAAVFVNNFTNHLYHLGSRICDENKLSFEILKPLIMETARKLNDLSPYDAQTGPARRGDEDSLKKHLHQLKSENEREIYTLLSQSIQNAYGKKL